MNTYQKIAIFILRITAVIMLAVALMGGCTYAVYEARGIVDAQMSLKFIATIVWFVAGLFLFVVSKPLGRLVGGGLD